MVDGAPAITDPVVFEDVPHMDDVVFAAFGNLDSSLEGAQALGNALAALEAKGPLDHVLLLGNVFGETPVSAVADPLIRERFEDVFPATLKAPFHFVPGAHESDYRGGPLVEYGNFTNRFDYPGPVYSFEAQSRGKTILFVGVDTGVITGSVAHPATRRSRTKVSHLLGAEADWKVVFAAGILQAGAAGAGAGGDAERTHAAAIKKVLSGILADRKPDLWIGAGSGYTSIQSVGALKQLQAGGGGGLQGAESARWTEQTEWVSTGGGFLWCRFDGSGLDVTVRGLDGKPLHTVRLSK